MRKLYIVAPNASVDASVEAAAASAGASEICQGIPRRLQGLVEENYPQVFTEPDDPDLSGLVLAAAVLRNQFGTTRSNLTQVSNALDAITLILRRTAKNEMNR
jgi:hypothetical protein